MIRSSTTTPASDEEYVELAEACNAKLVPPEPTYMPQREAGANSVTNPQGIRVAMDSEDEAIRSWYRLFRSVDTDNSGQISYQEFSTLLRHDLGLQKLGYTEPMVRAAWVRVDHDASGFISCGEFGKFMRTGQRVLRVNSDGRAKLTRAEQIELKAREAKAQREADKLLLPHGEAA